MDKYNVKNEIKDNLRLLLTILQKHSILFFFHSGTQEPNRNAMIVLNTLYFIHIFETFNMK